MDVPFYLKTENSLLQSMITIPGLISFAQEHKISTLAICDDTMYGVMDFYQGCVKNGIKPLVGLEIKFADKKVLLFAKNYYGYQNLTRINSCSKEDFNRDFLKNNSQDLICILPYESMELKDDLKVIFSDFYLGITKKEELVNIHEKVLYLPLVNALQFEDLDYFPYVQAIKQGVTLDKVVLENRSIPFISYSLKEEWQVLTKKNMDEIVSLCNLVIEKQDDLLPIYDCGNDSVSESADNYLKKLCIQGLKQKFGTKVYQGYIDRLKYELSIIAKMGFSNYFLVVWDYVKYARSCGILCQARGSAVGSLVAYLLDITNVDPLIYHLLFERFLNPMRVSMPDIDVDIDGERRKEVIDYCINKYGAKRVSGIITYITFKPKLVIRDVARVLEIAPEVTDSICRLLQDQDEHHHSLSLIDNYQRNPKLKNLIEQSVELKKLFKIATKLENLKKNISSHAAGIIISNKDLDSYIPLVSTQSMYLSGYSMEHIEPLGLLKMDFLGLKNLTLISNIISDLKKDNILVSLENILLNDKLTLDIFAKANTVGIFQFEKEGMRNFLRQLKPNSFEDIVAALALYRPGPMGSIPTYIKRKQGLEKVNYIDSSLEAILKPTYGIIIYQEQIMQIVHVMADYTLGEADILRKAISKKKNDLMQKELLEFEKRAILKGYSESTVKEVSNLLFKFAEYGYNRSHAVAYANLAYQLAYLKAHYKAYFMKGLMTHAIGRTLSTKDYIYECKSNNLEILKPSINLSSDDYQVENEALRYPLNNIRNVGDTVAKVILKERENGVFKDIYDFIRRVYSKVVNKKVLVSLIDAGCFDDFGFTRRTLQENLDIIINYGELLKDIDEEYALKPDIQVYEEYSNQQLMEKELEVFGFYFSGHPVTRFRSKYPNVLEIKKLPHYFNKTIKTIVAVKKLKVIQTKKQENMCFLTGEDEQASMDFILFPKLFTQNFDLQLGDILLITGKVEKRYDQYQIIVSFIEKLS